MKRLCDFYVNRAKLIGVLYCGVPVLLWYGGMFATVPFRSVYILRLVLSLAIGCWVAAQVNEYGVRLWLAKHRSPDGPATALDGAMIGAAVGMGVVLLPPLASFIATNHPVEARTVVIGCWVAGIMLGALNGSLLGAIGRRFIGRGDAPA
jgi:hypothetical protein